jgi:cation diffusion facilitator family transporter
VAAIAGSALLVGWESFQRLFQPRLIDQAGWVIGAGVVGAAGNELVARYRIRVGRRIGSQALVADGHHARSDAWTSLAVVAAGVGAVFGLAWVDPVAGLVVAVVIVWLLVGSIRGVGRRLLDGVDPYLVETAESVIRGVEGVWEVSELKVRFHGHRLHLTACVSVDPDLSVAEGHETAHRVEHELLHALPYPVTATIHIDPHGRSDAHRITAHHH